MPSDPNSLTRTAHFSPGGFAWRSRCASAVVLPTPSAPVIMLTGTGSFCDHHARVV